MTHLYFIQVTHAVQRRITIVTVETIISDASLYDDYNDSFLSVIQTADAFVKANEKNISFHVLTFKKYRTYLLRELRVLDKNHPVVEKDAFGEFIYSEICTSKLITAHVYTMVNQTLRLLTEEEAAETTAYTGRAKAWSEPLISRVRNVLFPKSHSAREKNILTAVPTLVLTVQNRRNVVPYDVNQTLARKGKKFLEKVRHT